MNVQMIKPKAMQMINEAISPLVRRGRRIDRMKLVVCPSAAIASLEMVQTKYGPLRIVPDGHVPKGVSYVIEDPGQVGRGFAWVSRRQVSQ